MYLLNFVAKCINHLVVFGSLHVVTSVFCGLRVVRKCVVTTCIIYFRDRNVFLSVLIYCTFSFALIGWNEVFPVWAKTSPHLGKHIILDTYRITGKFGGSFNLAIWANYV